LEAGENVAEEGEGAGFVEEFEGLVGGAAAGAAGVEAEDDGVGDAG
jgi:hypothetical protein